MVDNRVGGQVTLAERLPGRAEFGSWSFARRSAWVTNPIERRPTRSTPKPTYVCPIAVTAGRIGNDRHSTSGTHADQIAQGIVNPLPHTGFRPVAEEVVGGLRRAPTLDITARLVVQIRQLKYMLLDEWGQLRRAAS